MIQTIIKIWVLGITTLFLALAILNLPILIISIFNIKYFNDIFQAIYFYIVSPFLLGFLLYVIFLLKIKKSKKVQNKKDLNI